MAYVWTAESDALLLRCNDARMGITATRSALVKSGVRVSAPTIRKRLACFGRVAHLASDDRFWTAERDALLRELWQREPRMLIGQILAVMEVSVTEQTISHRAMALGLAPRNASAGKTRPRVVKPDDVVKVLYPARTRCPFYHPMETSGPCGTMVDRRPDANGVKPSQYCAAHRPRVMPIARGTLGTIATYAKGKLFA